MSDRLMMAVPRGALFGETLDLLERIGTDVSEVRSNDRKLLFAEPGIVTMRPSDVPTYVEHGSADIGITGKDVLLEQEQRKVYELLDLGYGRCTMVVATQRGGDPIGSALRRLGRVRIATKYPRVAARHFAETGPPGGDRGGQGLGGAGSAHRPRGRDRGPHRHRAHPGGERPSGGGGDRAVHGTPDRQSGVPQAQGGRRSTAWWRSCAREDLPGGQLEPAGPAGRGGGARCGPCWPRCATAATPRCWSSPSASTAPSCGPNELRVDAHTLDASVGVLEPAVLDGIRTAIANVRAVVEAQLREPTVVELPAGQRVEVAEPPVRRAGLYVPGGRAAYPSTVVMLAVTARAAGVDEIAVCAPPGSGWRGASGDPGRVRALRGHRGLPDGRRPGDRRPGVRNRVGAGRGRDRRTRATPTCRRPSARCWGPWESTGFRGPASWWWWPRARPTPS